MMDDGQRVTFAPSVVRPSSAGFRFGPIFTNAWSVYAANFLTFTGVALVIGLPDLIEADPQTTTGAVLLTLAGIAGLILEFMGLAVILYGAFQVMRGRDIAMLDMVRHVLSRFWAIIALALLLGIALFLGLMLFVLPAIVMAVRGSWRCPPAWSRGSARSPACSAAPISREGIAGRSSGCSWSHCCY